MNAALNMVGLVVEMITLPFRFLMAVPAVLFKLVKPWFPVVVLMYPAFHVAKAVSETHPTLSIALMAFGFLVFVVTFFRAAKYYRDN